MATLHTKHITSTLEVRPVTRSHDLIDVCDEECADFFSVYMRDHNEEAICIGDFDTKEKAIAFCERFYGPMIACT